MSQEDFSRFFQGLYNTSGFDGTIESDFLKLGNVPDDRKENLIDYNLKGFDDYRVALQNYLKAVYPLDYNNFAASDLGQMLLEMFAYMAAVLTLRADMTANEMYLDTVKTESNLKRLLQLIGVSMKGPTSSKATGKLTLAAGTTVPAGGVTIKNENRSLEIINQRNSTPLTYTIFNQQSNGRLDLWSTDVNIPQSDFTDNTTQNLFLLEGSLQSQAGSFTANNMRNNY